MGNNYKYFVVKDTKDMSITYFEYDKVEGYDLNPKKVKIRDAIDVNKMIVINPSLIEKLSYKKVTIKFNKLVRMMMYILSDDNNDDSGETYRQALNEVSKLRMEIKTKYNNKLKAEDERMFSNKLNLLEEELKRRLYYIEREYSNELSGKSR